MTQEPIKNVHYDTWIVDPNNMEDLRQKRALITGVSTTSGLGFNTTYGLLQKGCECIITSRDLAKGEQTKTALEEKCIESGVVFAPITVCQMDNCSFKSVKDCCEVIKSKFDTLDIIITNAGLMMGDYQKSQDGWEVQIQTNHLAHFLLIKNLFPLIKKAADAKTGFKPTITQVSSIAASVGNVKVHTDDLNVEAPSSSWFTSFVVGFAITDKSSWKRYCQSKFANVLCAWELADRLEAAGYGDKIISNVCHPGACRTNLQNDKTIKKSLLGKMDMMGHSPADGSLPSLMAAAGPARASQTMYGPEQDRYGPPAFAQCHNTNLKNAKMAKDLWEASEKIAGGTFDF
eukprot:Platyproteum_vivax@DN5570_c0_g1_i1.p1